MSNIRILLCDDHTLVRSGLVSLLKSEDGIFVIGEAENGKEMIKKYFETNPDLIIADIAMPELSGIDAFKKIKETNPDVKILFLSAYYSEQYIYVTLKAGAMGLLNKSITGGELSFAINEVMEGRKYFGASYNQKKLSGLIKKFELKKKSFLANEISEFDDKMLFLISEGFISDQIATKLFVSKHTIDAHRVKIMRKLKLKTGHDLQKYAILYTEGKKI
jgi:two-component system, NarL family, response regulator NreC